MAERDGELTDLDQLAELNPEPKHFKVTGRDGRGQRQTLVLTLRELEHRDYFKLVRDVSEFQRTADPSDLDNPAVETTALSILVQLFGPFNPEATIEFFASLPDRKLLYLINAGYAYQSAFAVVSQPAAAEGPPRPPEEAGPEAPEPAGQTSTKPSPWSEA